MHIKSVVDEVLEVNVDRDDTLYTAGGDSLAAVELAAQFTVTADSFRSVAEQLLGGVPFGSLETP